MAQDLTVEQLIARGKEAFSRNAYLAALEDLQDVAQRHPHFADVQNLIGLSLSLLGRPEEAVGAFKQAVDSNPGYVEAHLNLAITLNDLGRTEEARESFGRAAVADEEKSGGGYPSSVAARLANRHAELGDMYAEAGGLQDAVGQYELAVRLRPQFLDIRNKLGRTLLDLGRSDEALRELTDILDLNPAFAAARTNFGLALFRAGRLDEAEREWERCLTQSPGNAQVSSFLGMLRRRREGGAEA